MFYKAYEKKRLTLAFVLIYSAIATQTAYAQRRGGMQATIGKAQALMRANPSALATLPGVIAAQQARAERGMPDGVGNFGGYGIGYGGAYSPGYSSGYAGYEGDYQDFDGVYSDQGYSRGYAPARQSSVGDELAILPPPPRRPNGGFTLIVPSTAWVYLNGRGMLVTGERRNFYAPGIQPGQTAHYLVQVVNHNPSAGYKDIREFELTVPYEGLRNPYKIDFTDEYSRRVYDADETRANWSPR